MPANDRLQTVRDSYRAYVSGDRELIEAILGEEISRVEVYFGWDLE